MLFFFNIIFFAKGVNYFLLVSNFFFRDKFFMNPNSGFDEKSKVATWMNKYGSVILKKYRRHTPTDEKYKNAPTFREFIEYLLDLPLDEVVTHWLPMYYQCMPCHIEYTIIGR